MKSLISHLTKPKGLFYDGYQWLAERNEPMGNFIWEVRESDKITRDMVRIDYPHRYEEYKQNRFGWWTNTGNVVHCTAQLNKRG